jgi:hypothetical protein
MKLDALAKAMNIPEPSHNPLAEVMLMAKFILPHLRTKKTFNYVDSKCFRIVPQLSQTDSFQLSK